jgi:TfoX/Sxy family transcriptional regulator of competence genes
MRIRKFLNDLENMDVKKMFGGICYLLNGNMVGGVYKDYLIIRLGEKNAEQALKMSYVKTFDITGKPMKGWIIVESIGIMSNVDLRNWLDQAILFVQTLPSKIVSQDTGLI